MPVFVIVEFGGTYRAVIQEQNGDKEHRTILAAQNANGMPVLLYSTPC
jgi:hypothetical protein